MLNNKHSLICSHIDIADLTAHYGQLNNKHSLICSQMSECLLFNIVIIADLTKLKSAIELMGVKQQTFTHLFSH